MDRLANRQRHGNPSADAEPKLVVPLCCLFGSMARGQSLDGVFLFLGSVPIQMCVDRGM